jgi:hypothetical protein
LVQHKLKIKHLSRVLWGTEMCVPSIPYVQWQFCSSLLSKHGKERHFKKYKKFRVEHKLSLFSCCMWP